MLISSCLADWESVRGGTMGYKDRCTPGMGTAGVTGSLITLGSALSDGKRRKRRSAAVAGHSGLAGGRPLRLLEACKEDCGGLSWGKEAGV